MATRNRTATNGTAENVPQAEAATPTLQLDSPAAEPTEDNQQPVTSETAAPAAEPTEDAENAPEIESEVGFENGFVDTNETVDASFAADSTEVLLVSTEPLSRQDAIAQVNAANHDLVGLLEPLFSATPMQKRLAELVARQTGLTEAGAAAWLLNVKQLLEDKKRASQSLIRSLIA